MKTEIFLLKIPLRSRVFHLCSRGNIKNDDKRLQHQMSWLEYCSVITFKKLHFLLSIWRRLISAFKNVQFGKHLEWTQLPLFVAFCHFMTGQNAENLQCDRSLFHVKALYCIGWVKLLSFDVFRDQISILSLRFVVQGSMACYVFCHSQNCQTGLEHLIDRNDDYFNCTIQFNLDKPFLL